MNKGKPVTSFLITAIALYAVWLWRHGRLGHISKVEMLPRPVLGPPIPPGLVLGGWKVGTPPIVSPATPEQTQRNYPSIGVGGGPPVFGG